MTSSNSVLVCEVYICCFGWDFAGINETSDDHSKDFAGINAISGNMGHDENPSNDDKGQDYEELDPSSTNEDSIEEIEADLAPDKDRGDFQNP